MYQKYSQ